MDVVLNLVEGWILTKHIPAVAQVQTTCNRSAEAGKAKGNKMSKNEKREQNGKNSFSSNEEGKYDNLLGKLYYDSNENTFIGPFRSIYEKAKKLEKNITQKDVANFLANQRTVLLHRTRRKKFPRRHVVKLFPFDTFTMDIILIDALKTSNNNYSYLLAVRDLFSSFNFVRPL